MKHIMISGDDFGMNESCSAAIALAFERGVITHTGMMANGMYFDEAVRLAEKNGFVDRIGIHFNLTEGEPLTAKIRDVGAFVKGGRFHKAYLRHPQSLQPSEREAVYEELSAQVERLTESGITVSHADSHHYLHTFEALAPIFRKVCKAHGILRIRLNRTFDTAERPMITEDRIDNAYWRDEGFVTTKRFGRMSDVAAGEIPDDTEIMVHPDLDRDNRLIDRTGVENGFPIGTPLIKLV